MSYKAVNSFAYKSIFERLFFLFCKFFFRFYCPLHITGQDNLPKSPFILCSNHCSHIDTPVLMLATQLYFNKLGIIAAEDYFFTHKKKRWLPRAFMNIIPINRRCTRQSISTTIQQCRSFINQGGGCLIIYPEGTRSFDGKIQPFKRGVSFIASELQLPIVPVSIQGTHRALAKNQFIPKPGKIHIIIGKALPFEEASSRQHQRSTINHTLKQNIQELNTI